MAQKAVIKEQEEFDALDEETQEKYKVAQDGKSWFFDLEGIDDHPTVAGMATTIRKFKELAPSAKALKKTLEDFAVMKESWDGLDADETKAELARLAELEDGDNKVDVEARITADRVVQQKKFDKKFAEMQTQLDDSKTETASGIKVIEKKTVETEVDAAMTHHSFRPEMRNTAKATIKQDYRPTVERVEDEDTGEISYRGVIKTEGGPVSIPDFFERWVTEEESEIFLPASGNIGSGSKTADGKKITGKKTNPWSEEHWNLTEQGSIVRKNRAVAIQLAAVHNKTIAAEA